MHSVGLEALKNELSESIRLVAAGETILVTDRGVVVAELIPPRKGRADRIDDEHVAELVRLGIVELPKAPSVGPPPRAPIGSTETILEGLDADRADR